MDNLLVDPFYGSLTIPQLSHKRLRESTLGDHGITADRPVLILIWIYTSIMVYQHRLWPS
jgi:hypothetical protein